MDNWQEQFDKLPWLRDGFVNRDMLKDFIQSLLDQQKKKLLEKVNLVWEPAHTYASENADDYRMWDNGYKAAIRDLKALKKSLSQE